MISLFRRVRALLTGERELPGDFGGVLGDEERVLATATGAEGPLVATNLGLWVPDESGARRVGWHLLSKVRWQDGLLGLVEAEEWWWVEGAVLLRDRPRRDYRLSAAGKLPDVVHSRVTRSIRSTQHRELPSVGGARFVRRRVPGRDGTVLQVRADAGTDEAALAEYTREVARRLERAAETGE
ncbi:hypothetical protein CDG81_06305 [Actinopolyspora erythraea]|uniref:Uncharacterized protein n=1 Tax=Actinopolyspora erythraea TaxID=414996 RepID=A0A099D120_9ACTN|nr:hypothetical protein [Actinopolyspora erythraea]ASU77984.1 hypothetical protein CDG81_06305 [Actinopolyspora erythraea]KGI79749.1 hypothetical protein IL38_21330 [Actinopolyspora erythraea]